MSKFRDDPVLPISCRRILKMNDLRTIRDYFPGSVGVRVLVGGFVLILFEDQKSMKRCWEMGAPESIGGQRPGYLVTRYEKTSDRGMHAKWTKGYDDHDSRLRQVLFQRFIVEVASLGVVSFDSRCAG
jgi:hypothetical protein